MGFEFRAGSQTRLVMQAAIGRKKKKKKHVFLFVCCIEIAMKSGYNDGSIKSPLIDRVKSNEQHHLIKCSRFFTNDVFDRTPASIPLFFKARDLHPTCSRLIWPLLSVLSRFLTRSDDLHNPRSKLNQYSDTRI